MVDQLLFKQQSLEFQFQKIIEPPKIKCREHKSSNCAFLNLDSQFNNILICSKCITSHNLNGSQLVCLEEIFEEDFNKIIQNWPFIEELSVKQQLNSKNLQISELKEYVQKISTLYKNIRRKFFKIINDQEKMVLSYVNSIEENRQNLLKTYHKISEKAELKKQFIINQNNLQELEDYLRNIIQFKQQQQKQNSVILQDNLDIFIKSQQKLKLDQIDQFFQQILKFFNFLDISNPLQQFVVTQYQENTLLEKNKNKYDELQFKVDQIIQLIDNKTNFCSISFLNNMKDILLKNKQIFSHLEFTQQFKENKKPVQFQYLSEDELSQFSLIVEQQIKQVQESNSNLSNYLPIKENNKSELPLSMINNLVNKNESETQENLKSIFEKLNQFENSIEKCIKYQKNDNLLPEAKMVKQIDCISWKRTDINQLEVEHNDKDNIGSVALDLQIKPENKYQILVELQDQNQLIFFGLGEKRKCQRNDLDKNLLCTPSKEGIHKIEKGKHISDILEEVKFVKIQICLNEKILRCLAITNDKQNINSLSNWNYIKQDDIYFFQIVMFFPKQKSIIKEFRIVNEFEQW